MDNLYRIGKVIISDHIQRLKKEKHDKTYYRIVGSDGLPTGRALKECGPTHKKLFTRQTLYRLTPEEAGRIGSPNKYEDSYRSIVYPCGGGCGRQYCGYCSLRKKGAVFPKDAHAAQLLLLHTMACMKWVGFKKDKNLAPTKVVCKLLLEDHRYMGALQTTRGWPFLLPAAVPVLLTLTGEEKEIKRPVLPALPAPAPLEEKRPRVPALPAPNTLVLHVPPQKEDPMAWWWFLLLVLSILLRWRR